MRQIYIQGDEISKRVAGYIRDAVTYKPPLAINPGFSHLQAMCIHHKFSGEKSIDLKHGISRFHYLAAIERREKKSLVKAHILDAESSCQNALTIIEKTKNPPRRMIKEEVAIKKLLVMMRKITKEFISR